MSEQNKLKDLENQKNIQKQSNGLPKNKSTIEIDDNLENKKDWKQGYGVISRLFLMHLASLSIHIKRVLKKGIPLNLSHLQILNEEEKVENNSQKFMAKLEVLQNKTTLTPMNVWRALMSIFNSKIIIIFTYQFFDSSLKLFNSVALNFCIQAILDGDTNLTYIWAAIMILSMFFSSLFRQNGWAVGFNLNSELRGCLISTIYQKINKLSGYAIKSANLGKVINLISSDMNITEQKFFYLFQMATGIYTLSMSCLILGFRLGPLGLISIALLILIFPLQKYIGKLSSKYTYKRIQKSDERIRLINEIIEGVRIIKMYGWEVAMKQILEKIRNEEVQQNIKAQILQYIEKAISYSVVLLSATITFIIIYYEGSYELNSAKIFSTIEMLSYVRVNVMQFSGQGFAYIFELQIFLRRFIEIYNIKDITSNSKDYSNTNYNKIQPNEIAKFDNFSSYWKLPTYLIKQQSGGPSQTVLNTVTQTHIKTKEDIQQLNEIEEDIKPTLKNLSFGINQGELLGVVGKVGSGKSTLLQVFLNEIPHFKGYFEVQQNNQSGKPIKVAYVEQEPYIFSGNVRDNILFGSEFDQQWYNTVTKNCCLLPDFQLMDQGDKTVIGERGVNLSGGQKARICLARAVYSQADIYLLDDPLSAVDSKVAKELFFSCLRGVLKEKTVILVTHQIHFTRNCDRIAILEDGSLKNIGTFDELHEDLKVLTAGSLKFENKALNQSTNSSKNVNFVDQNKIQRKEQDSSDEDDELNEINLEKKEVKSSPKQATQEIVKIDLNTYKRYLSLINSVFCGFSLFILILFVAAECAYTTFNRGLGYYDSTSDDSKDNLFGFLIGFASLYMVLNAIKNIVLSVGIQKGNRKLHNNMLSSLIRAPVLFFDKTSSGNLMNKFSNDISLLDNLLHFSSSDSLDIFCNFMNLVITCCVFNPYIIIPGVIQLVLLYQFMIYNKDIIIKVRQMDLQQKTPVFSHFNSSLSGVIPIKVYRQNHVFLNKMNVLCNNSQQANMTFWLTSRFFGGYIQGIAIIMSAIGVFIIIAVPNEDLSKQSQSITYFMLMVDALQWCLRQMITTDSIMSSFERTSTLVNEHSEASLNTEFDSNFIKKVGSNEQQSLWPYKGEVEFKNVVMKYQKELNPVLKGLTFNVQTGQKIGCVGRTGAGKSSILQVLFRLTEPEQGSQILIDGIDIQKLGLHKLRQSISIIPQIPFVFGGTIRRNLDPLNEHSDEEIWNSLALVELDQYVKQNCAKGIETDMSVASSVFSVGQKQLICLARALLKKNKILVLDEATANVDMETDNFIQKTIRTKFQNCTVITIAHRLNTIADYDKVMVMNDGVVAEYDSPFALLARSIEDQTITQDTIFAQMVKNTGKNNSANIFQLSKEKFKSELKH